MAYDFPNGDGAINQSNLLASSVPVTSAPFTVSYWVNPDINCVIGMSISVIRNTAGTDAFTNFLGANSNPNPNPTLGYIQAAGSGDVFGAVGASNTNNIGSWVHCACVFASTTSRTAYRNGVSVGTNNTNRSPSGINEFRIGATTNSLDGKLADFALWDAALTADEISSLAKGFAARRVRPTSLKFYAPLLRELQDVRQGIGLTNNNNCATSVHPRIYA